MANLDPVPLQVSVDVKGEALNQVWQQWFSSMVDYLSKLPDFFDPYIITPSNGFAVTIPDMTKVVTLDISGALASGTLTLPDNPYDGQSMIISSTDTVTTFTLSGNGAAVKNPPASLSAGVGVEYYYRAANATWYRVC